MTTATLALMMPMQPAGTHAARASNAVATAQLPSPVEPDQADRLADGSQQVIWQVTTSGIKFVDEHIGNEGYPGEDAVVSLHYTVSFAESGMVLGTSRENRPLSFHVSKQKVPIFAEGIAGMQVGGRRRLVVPAHMIPESQIQNVPQDQAGEGLRFDIELVGIETGAKAFALSVLPPGNRRLTVARTLFLLSFVPYCFPENMKPESYKFGDVNEIVEARAAASNSVWLGGAAQPLDALFPE